MAHETYANPLPSDAPLLEMLRVEGRAGISELEAGLGVTATAVRQRLERLMRSALVERSTVSRGRGRPSHVYSLTDKGRRVGGDNFQDLALVLWREVRTVSDPAVRRGQAIIRTSYMATHTPEQLEYVLETFERIARELNIFEDDAYQRAAGEIPQRHHDTPVSQPVRTAAV
jgi:predicted ArsR family transcriptional regulator